MEPEPIVIPPQFKLHKSRIIVGDRMREDLGTEQEQHELANSIKEFGCIHPPSVDEKGNLVAGGRRFHVMTTILNWDFIPVNLAETGGSMAKLRMMELEENVRRLPMTWKERVKSVAEVHKLHRNEGFLRGESWTQEQTGDLLGLSDGNVNYSVTMAKLLRDPNHPIQEAESLNDAIRILLLQKEEEVIKYESTLVQEIKQSGGYKSKGAALSIDSLIGSMEKAADGSVVDPNPAVDVSELLDTDDDDEVVEGATPETAAVVSSKEQLQIEVGKYFHHGDCIVYMNEQIPAETIDHIITDIPYGIDMTMLQQSSTQLIDVSDVEDEHDVKSNVDLYRKFFPAAFRVLKPNAFCVVWYDLDHHQLFKDLGTAAGFKVCRWPLHWVKTHRCKNQAAQYNFTKATEHAMVFRKGNSTLVTPQGTNYWAGGNEESVAEFGHPFAKPEALWKWIANAVAPKGSVILDPFMGAGSGPIAFSKGGYYPRGIELKEEHYGKAITKFKELMTRWFADKEVVFV